LKTATQVKAELRRKGINVAAWARSNNIHPQTVQDLLRGKLVGHRGQAHRAAVLLGLKDGDVSDLPSPASTR
jgi:gp16 family phage-associated protein